MNPSELTKFKIDFYADLVRNRSLSATDLSVAWLLIFKYLNRESMTAWPSAETLAADLGRTVGTVRRSIGRLTTPGGYFIVARGGGRGQSNRYRANTETVSPETPFKESETVSPTPPFSEETVSPETVKGIVHARKRVSPAPPDTFEVNPLRTPLREGARARGPTNSHSGEEGTKIDPAWQPRLAECEVGYELELDDRAITAEADLFRDYYLGNGEKREDWNAVFRTWLRRVPSFDRGQGRASANTKEQDQLGLIAGLALDTMGSSGPARVDAERAEMKERGDRRRAVELRQHIKWCEGQEMKLEASFAGPIAEASRELEGILNRLSGEGHA